MVFQARFRCGIFAVRASRFPVTLCVCRCVCSTLHAITNTGAVYYSAVRDRIHGVYTSCIAAETSPVPSASTKTEVSDIRLLWRNLLMRAYLIREWTGIVRIDHRPIRTLGRQLTCGSKYTRFPMLTSTTTSYCGQAYRAFACSTLGA